MKLQTRIALLFTLSCSLLLITVSSVVYYVANNNAFQDFYTRLQLRADIAARVYLDTDKTSTGAFERIRAEHLQRLPEEREDIFHLDSLPALRSGLPYSRLPPSFFQVLREEQAASYRDGYRFYRGIRYGTPQGDYGVIVSAEHSYARDFLQNLRTILITVNLLGVVFIFTIGFLFSRQALSPIRKIRQEMNAISATSLHKRLAVKEGNDEIAELGNTFNHLLGRLETAFETQNNFVSNASHELNTPLTAIMGEAEFALSRERSPEVYRQSMEVVLSQAEKLRNITHSLLQLAQAGFSGNLSFEEVEVEPLLQQVLDVAHGIYPDCNLQQNNSLTPAQKQTLTLNGNFHLLELCLSNLLLNACKYSGGNAVTVAVAASEKDILFLITDRGIGIPARDLPNIFDPFFRASNVHASEGYGIGLPLAKSIVRLHKGDLSVSSQEGRGTEVIVKFPRDDARRHKSKAKL